jgi:hypothetical protein
VLGVSIGLAVAHISFTGIWIGAIIPLMMGLYLMIPIVVPFKCEVPWAIVVATVIALGFAGLYLFFNLGVLFGRLFDGVLSLFMLGIVVYCFASQLLMRMEKRT